MIAFQRRLALIGRVELFASRWRRPFGLLGTATLGMAKILENMEIGHNVMHGQWDWMNDPVINSRAWDWDTASTAESWRHSHNYIHHTYTNILGKDHDLGYDIMRIDPNQKWHPVYLLQPDLQRAARRCCSSGGWRCTTSTSRRSATGEKSQKELLKDLKGIAGKARLQIQKDYIAWPVLSGLIVTLIEFAGVRAARGGEPDEPDQRPVAPGPSRLGRKLRPGGKAALGRACCGSSSSARSFREPFRRTVIGQRGGQPDPQRVVLRDHLLRPLPGPDVHVHPGGDRGRDPRRAGTCASSLGAANIDGGPMFHVISGNLGYQVEHHLFPGHALHPLRRDRAEGARDLRALRAAVQHGPFHQQLGTVQRTILRLAFPGGKPRPKPGPYHGPRVRGSGEGAREEVRAAA